MSKKSIQGFTLIELAIVLVVVAILIGGFVGMLASRIENNRITDTQDELEKIKQALIGYTYVNGYLPCPDCISPGCNALGFRDGMEDRVGGVAGAACNAGNSVGSVPWVTLGLAPGDAWNTRYRYWVDNAYAVDDPNIPLNPGDPDDVFTLDSAAGIGIIQEPDYVADPTGATLGNLAINVVAVVFSHGKNTFGGRSISDALNPVIPAANVDELENTDDDGVNGIFVERPPSTVDATTAGGEFDDILIWLSEYELKAKMVEAGVLP